MPTRGYVWCAAGASVVAGILLKGEERVRTGLLKYAKYNIVNSVAHQVWSLEVA